MIRLRGPRTAARLRPEQAETCEAVDRPGDAAGGNETRTNQQGGGSVKSLGLELTRSCQDHYITDRASPQQHLPTCYLLFDSVCLSHHLQTVEVTSWAYRHARGDLPYPQWMDEPTHTHTHTLGCGPSAPEAGASRPCIPEL